MEAIHKLWISSVVNSCVIANIPCRKLFLGNYCRAGRVKDWQICIKFIGIFQSLFKWCKRASLALDVWRTLPIFDIRWLPLAFDRSFDSKWFILLNNFSIYCSGTINTGDVITGQKFLVTGDVCVCHVTEPPNTSLVEGSLQVVCVWVPSQIQMGSFSHQYDLLTNCILEYPKQSIAYAKCKNRLLQILAELGLSLRAVLIQVVIS